MNKRILIACLFAILMLLVPLTSVVGVSDVEEDCGCREIDKTNHIQFERQLKRLEVYTKLLLTLSKYNPEITDKCEEIIDIINYNILWDFPIFCSVLQKLFDLTYSLYNTVGDIGDYLIEKFPNLKFLICIILVPIFESLGISLGYMYFFGAAFCNWEWPPPPPY